MVMSARWSRGLKLEHFQIALSDVNSTLHKRQHQIPPNSGCSPGDYCEAITETLEHEQRTGY